MTRSVQISIRWGEIPTYINVKHDGMQTIPKEILKEMVFCIYDNAKKFWLYEGNQGFDTKLNMLILKDILSKSNNLNVLTWVAQFYRLDMSSNNTSEFFCETINFELSQS